MSDVVLHEQIATHLPALRMAIATVAIPVGRMLPVNQAEKRQVETAIAYLDHAIAHHAEIVRTLKSARKLMRLQAAFVEEE